jgi:IS30 family transposase
MSYHHLTYFERSFVQSGLRVGLSQRKIAKMLGVNVSSVSREIKRNKKDSGAYDALHAQYQSRARRQAASQPPKLSHPPLRTYVEEKIAEDWSPEQVAGALKLKHPQDPKMQVSHETVYQHVYADKQRGGTLYTHLRQGRKKRHKRGGKGRRAIIKNRKFISERPAVVQRQKRVGDWEGDTVIGKNRKSPIAVAVERKCLYLRAVLMPDKSAASLNRAMRKAYQQVPRKLRHTLTLDNGTEIAAHEKLARELGMQIYFGQPYTSNDRAICENLIGLLRQYLPKGTDFRTITQEELNQYVQKLNNRPRKKLGYRTPAQMMRVALQP